MKKVELFLNIIHYKWFRFEIWSGKIFDYPVLLLMKFKPLRRRFIEKYMDKNFDSPEEYFKSYQKDPEKSFNSILSGGATGGMIALFFFGIAFIFSALLKFDSNKLFLFFASMIPTLLVSYRFLFRNNLYLKYFRQFYDKSKNWQRKWSWITIFTFFGVIIFVVGCFFMHILLL